MQNILINLYILYIFILGFLEIYSCTERSNILQLIELPYHDSLNYPEQKTQSLQLWSNSSN